MGKIIERKIISMRVIIMDQEIEVQVSNSNP